LLFKPGDHVHVPGLGTGIVREPRNRGRVVVEIKGHSMLVDESQLSAVDPPRPKKQKPAPAEQVPEALARSHAAASIDLHGMTTEEAAVALEVFISDAILAGHEAVQVIHGRSGGRLKAAVHARLAELPSVRGFRVDPANDGVTLVRL
jgi:dsDNA-specific endonuclease/ATPase MutS2